MAGTYNPPLALTIISGIFLALGAICFLVVLGHIIWRRGWQSMMWIMIPVYPINAAYMLPVTLFVYFKYGKAAKPSEAKPSCHASQETGADQQMQSHGKHQQTENADNCDGDNGDNSQPRTRSDGDHPQLNTSDSDLEKAEESADNPHAHHHHDDSGDSRPMWVTVLIGVSHCGAGCVLGDVVGEWIVWGTGATINGHSIWVNLLVDYGFALLFGIVFQYFSIAPMSGEYGPKTVLRAAKADILSLTSFEVGLFGWMIIYQVGIFNYQLDTVTWTYWWMMQAGMVMGFATAMPVNYFLITKGIKEPCA